ncbi:hypothetical protein EJ06DRAFT_267486 [Trichodelitschia bisporula]|uniref:Uncharacterized protein n=1 Tax=Trichodelitschia bisporula TaxID=703511 RepID=A0A6G1HI57_9PEZI|nr:hypothetical protein EJ06DRAFT_267486 [Trichodelitschia bisporula]
MPGLVCTACLARSAWCSTTARRHRASLYVLPDSAERLSKRSRSHLVVSGSTIRTRTRVGRDPLRWPPCKRNMLHESGRTMEARAAAAQVSALFKRRRVVRAERMGGRIGGICSFALDL